MLGLTVDAEPTIGALLAKVHNEDRDTLQRQIEQSARWGRPFDTECRIVLPDGHIRWLSVKGQSTRRQADPAEQVTGVVLDISERKAEQIQAEQQRNQIGRAQSELQSLMRISYAVFCLKKKKKIRKTHSR